MNNAGETWVTVFALMRMLNGKKQKATEIADWLYFEVLPQIAEKGGYIDESATPEQLLALQKEIDERVEQAKLEERNRRVFTAQQICNRIKVPNLTCESLFVYLQSYKLGTIIYNDDGSIKKFKHNNKFKENFIQNGYGYAREGNNGFLDFYKEFAERVNKSPKALESLKFINENKDEQLEF